MRLFRSLPPTLPAFSNVSLEVGRPIPLRNRRTFSGFLVGPHDPRRRYNISFYILDIDGFAVVGVNRITHLATPRTCCGSGEINFEKMAIIQGAFTSNKLVRSYFSISLNIGKCALPIFAAVSSSASAQPSPIRSLSVDMRRSLCLGFDHDIFKSPNAPGLHTHCPPPLFARVSDVSLPNSPIYSDMYRNGSLIAFNFQKIKHFAHILKCLYWYGCLGHG